MVKKLRADFIRSFENLTEIELKLTIFLSRLFLLLYRLVIVIKILENLFIGNENDCFFEEKPDWAAIHCCKSPCHQAIIGYKGSLSPHHPYYLVYEKGHHLFLNMVDPPVPLFKPELFTRALNFIDNYSTECKVLVHCNKGESRAPSVGLLYLSKRAKTINGESFLEAAKDFKKIYPYYQPGRGLAIYLNQNWLLLE